MPSSCTYPEPSTLWAFSLPRSSARTLCQHVMSLFVHASCVVTCVWQQHDYKACRSFAAAHITYLEACIETRHIDSAAHCRSPALTHQLLVLLYLLHMLKLIINTDILSIRQSISPHNTSDSSLQHGFKTKSQQQVRPYSACRFQTLICHSCGRASSRLHASCINSGRWRQVSIKLEGR